MDWKIFSNHKTDNKLSKLYKNMQKENNHTETDEKSEGFKKYFQMNLKLKLTRYFVYTNKTTAKLPLHTC